MSDEHYESVKQIAQKHAANLLTRHGVGGVVSASVGDPIGAGVPQLGLRWLDGANQCMRSYALPRGWCPNDGRKHAMDIALTYAEQFAAEVKATDVS